jgi:hypothetical protein
MGSEENAVYIMQETEGEEWVSPRPVRAAIVEVVTTRTDLAADDLDDIDSYVDPDQVREVIEGDEESVTFTVEGHEVTLSEDGAIELAE